MGHPNQQVLTGVISEYNESLLDDLATLNPQLDGSFSTRYWDEAGFNKKFAHNDERAMVAATLGGIVVGGAIVGSLHEQALEASSAYVGGVVVSEDLRGQRVGERIMLELEEAARDMGLPVIALNTEAQRQAAIALYKKLGYREVPGTGGHYDKPLDPTTPALIVPHHVIRAFHGSAPTFTGPLTGGLVHGTYYGETWGGDGIESRRISQRLSPRLDPRLIEVNATVTGLLRARGGLIVPETIAAADGKNTVLDNHGNAWRQLEFIDSPKGAVPELTTKEQLEAVGAYVAKVHQALAALGDYEPTYSIPHFHDTDYFFGQLETLQSKLPDGDFANKVLDAYKKLRPDLPKGNTQLIHGDIQPTNMLFDENDRPFATIDWDTTMRGTIWVDLGDMLRATIEYDVKSGRPLDIEKLRPITEGYRREAGITDSPEVFYGKCAKATQQISLELAMRFMNDLAQGTRYFGADDAKLVALANIQWDIHKALEAQQNV